MRSVWRGSVAFGMVTIPVRLYSATQEHDIRFHQVHAADGGRIRYKRTCEVDGQEVPYDQIDRAVFRDDGTEIIVEKDELDALAVQSGHEIDVVQFVPAEQIDPVLFNRSYYMEPESKSVKPYVLLREALRDTDRIAIARIVLRQRESLAALRVRGDVIIIQTMLWPDEVRSPEFEVLSAEISLRRQEQQMAESLVESLTEDYDPAAFTDRYTEAVAELIEAKASEGGAQAPPRATESVGQEQDASVTDLVDVLRASVDRAKADRAGHDTRAHSKSDSASSGKGSSTSSRRSAGKSSAKSKPDEPVSGDEPESSQPKRTSSRRRRSA